MNQLISSLKLGAIRLSEKEDEIIWSKNKATKNYIAKLGYDVKNRENEEEERDGGNIYRSSKSPLKTRMLALSNKILTQDICKIRTWKGLGWCILCNKDEESNFELTTRKGKWEREIVFDCFKTRAMVQ